MGLSQTFDASNQYFSGQGVVMLGSKDPVTGKSLGFRPLGNVTDLKVNIATTVIDHKGSQDGQRTTDARLQTETKATATITIDSWIAANLAKALRGGSTAIPAGTVSSEAITGYGGLVVGLQYINISSLVLTGPSSSTLVQYTDAVTAYDYRFNLAAGSFELNDGISLPTATTALGVTATAVTVGATTAITIPNTAAIGDTVYIVSGFGGADAAFLNGHTAVVTAASPTAISVNINTTGKTITVSTASIYFPATPVSITAAYSYAAQTLTAALTQPLNNVWLRFEGLNTVNTNSPVVVDLFKFSTDPLKELALISDTFGQFEIEGALLSDPTRPTGTSKYFSVKQLY